MGHALLWIESLVLPLLLVAVCLACISRWTSRQEFWLAEMPIVVVVWVGIAAAFAFVTHCCLDKRDILRFLWQVSLVLAAIGASWLLLRKTPLWARANLSALWGVTLLLIATGLAWQERSLLIMAAVGAVTAIVGSCVSLTRRPGQVLAVLLLALLPLVAYAGLSALTYWLCSIGHAVNRLSLSLLAPLFALTLFYALGMILLLFRGLRRGSDGAMPAAARWPRRKLAIALVGVAVFQGATVWTLDQAARERATALEFETNTLGLAAAPARIPDRENAAFLYQQALAQIPPWPEPEWPKGMPVPPPVQGAPDWTPPPLSSYEKWTQWKPTGPLGFDPDDPELRSFLKGNEIALTLLRKGAAKPGCFFDWDYAHASVNSQLPEASPLRAATDRLALDALVRAAHGDSHGAFEDIQAMYLIAEHFHGQPYLVTCWLAGDIDGRATDTLQRVLASSRINEPDLTLFRSWEGPSYRAVFNRVSAMEEALLLDAIRQYTCKRADQLGIFDGIGRPVWHFAVVYRILLFDADLAAYRRLAVEYERIGRGESYRDMRDRAVAFDQRMLCEPGATVTHDWWVSSAPIVEKLAIADARRRLVCVGLALCHYRTKNGRNPEKLDALTPGYLALLPHDPFDDKAMKLKRTERGVIVYSVGPDLKDDGGAAFDETNKTGDIAFECPDPKS